MKLVKFLVIFFVCFIFVATSLFAGYILADSANQNSNKFNNQYITDRISEQNIFVSSDKITIFGKYVISSYYDTKSMFPVADKNSNGIYIDANQDSEIYVGDIISFIRDNKSITHRIIEKHTDTDGIYYVTKGDNSPYPDPYKIRKRDINRIMVGVLW